MKLLNVPEGHKKSETFFCVSKKISLMVLVLFLVSIMPVSSIRMPTAVEQGKTDDTSSQQVNAVQATKVEEQAIKKVETQEQFGEKREALIEKLRSLDATKLRRLQALNNVRLEKITALNKTQINKIAALSRARQKELADINQSDMEEVLAKIKIKTVNKAEDLRLRVLSMQRLEIAKNNFIKARLRYENARVAYQTARARYLAAKESGDEEAAIEHAKEVLLQSADAIIGHLEKIKAKINESENIDEERAQDLIDRIDAQIAELEEIIEKIEAATTTEEIRDLARELNVKWKNFKPKVRAFAERVVSARVQGVINQIRVLEKKLDAALTRMEEAGIEVDVDAEVDEFSSLVEDAKGKIEEAKEKLEQAIDETEKETIESLVDEAKSLIDDSRDLIKEAHEKLKEIVGKIREAGQELEIDETEEVEIEEE